MKSTKRKYYAYFVPGEGAAVRQGVTSEWKVCESIVSGVTGARYKSFEDRARAEQWLAGGAMYESRPSIVRRRATLDPGIYFDAGTGRGEGVEVSVTDERGNDLLHRAVPVGALNRFGKHRIDDEAATNNYGELLALRFALEIAMETGIAKIFGDSKLVIDYWSRRKIKRKEVAAETVALADEVAALRARFEEGGGTVTRISGDDNPADLGFHR